MDNVTTKPLVSIIVRTKDRPKLLERALESIAAQDYRPIEVVLVNDGGCDVDVEKLGSIFGDLVINYIRLEKTAGRAGAGNVGLKNTRGEYIGFLDDDDALYPEHVSFLVSFLERNNYRVAYTDAEIVHLSDIHETGEIKELQSYPRESVDFYLETLLLQNYISFMTLLFDRTVLLETGGFDEAFDLCEDWDILIRIGSKHPFYHLRKITAKYSFWSKESQVTIGHEKLAPYRLQILTKHREKITPQALFNLIYEGKLLSDLAYVEKNKALEEKIVELKKENSFLQFKYKNLKSDLHGEEIKAEYRSSAPEGTVKQETLRDARVKEGHYPSGALEEFFGDDVQKVTASVQYPPLSIILRVKNEGKTLEQVIKGIMNQEYPSPVEIVVVDSGSTDNTIEIASRYNCKVIRMAPEEFTFGRALNAGYREAHGEVFVNLSGHSIPHDTHFLRNLIAPYEDPLVMATFGRNVSLPEACPSEARDLEYWYPDEFVDVPERFSNGNASLRKIAWEKIPFNEHVSGSEDIIWAQQIMKRGLQIIYVPKASVFHSHSVSPRYAFIRRLRETKAIIANGQHFEMSFRNFLKWTVHQVMADSRFAKQRQYAFTWYAHIPVYRLSQGWGMYKAARIKKDREGAPDHQHRVSVQEKIIGYYQKSCRVIKEEGWRSFYHKAKRKVLTKLNLVQISLAPQEPAVPVVSPFPSPRKFRVLFVVDPLGPLTNHFRANNVRAYFAIFNIESEVVSEKGLDYGRISSFDVVVLCRVFMDPPIEQLVEHCRQLNVPVIFDADDFIIDPAILDSIAPLEKLSDYEKSLHREGLRKHQNSFSAADFFTAPTHYLAEAGRRLGKQSFVIRNGFSTSQIDLCKKIIDIKGQSPDDNRPVRIGYFSGTKSHERDFSVVIPALVKLMQEFPNVYLYIGGYLALDKNLEQFGDRIKRLPFVDIEKLPYNIAKVDITLAPLEVHNPFCEAKSELKYFDAGLLKIPTIASPTDAFTWAIENGYNGFLANTPDEWYRCLKKLVEDESLRTLMGQRAYEHVLKYYTPNAMAAAVKSVYEEMITEYRQRRGISSRTLKISFVVPAPVEGSGGHNKIFTAAKYLSEFGHAVCLYFINDGQFGSRTQLKEFISAHYFDPLAEIVLGTDFIFSCDALCATSWTSAYVVNKHRDRAAKLFYFVQDIESLFFPMSDNYLKAENTYSMGMHHISLGPWCAKVIEERYRAVVDYIPFSLNREIYYPRPVEKQKTKKVLFFARPEMARRCFWLGLEALSIVKKRNPSVTVTLFGSDQIRHHTVPFPHEQLGVLSREELTQLYSSADIGIAFSTTNPSLVPFEMMACGCPVVDFDYNDNHINYGSRENVKLVGISPEEIAKGVEELLQNDALRHQIAENGFKYVNDFPDDRQTFKEMEDIFLSAFDLKKLQAAPETHHTEIVSRP